MKEYMVSRLLVHYDLQPYLDGCVHHGWQIHKAEFRQVDGFWMVIMERENGLGDKTKAGR